MNTKPLLIVIDDTYIDSYYFERLVKKNVIDCEYLYFDMATHALDYFKSLQCTPKSQVNYIFLDIHMPLMNGFEFLEEYAKLCDNIKNSFRLYMLSSAITFEDKQQSLLFKDVINFIEKPINKQVVIDIITQSCVAI